MAEPHNDSQTNRRAADTKAAAAPSTSPAKPATPFVPVKSKAREYSENAASTFVVSEDNA
jgi:hypothetical protein